MPFQDYERRQTKKDSAEWKDLVETGWITAFVAIDGTAHMMRPTKTPQKESGK